MVKATTKTDVVKLRLVDVVMVNLIVAETFESFFDDNDIDPAAIAPSFSSSFPPDYAANYDPDRGGIIKQNRFVRNMASVLRINPERIRVTNIVPGNRRRRMQDAASCTATDVAEHLRAMPPWSTTRQARSANVGCVFVAPRYLQEADDLDIGLISPPSTRARLSTAASTANATTRASASARPTGLATSCPKAAASTGTESD